MELILGMRGTKYYDRLTIFGTYINLVSLTPPRGEATIKNKKIRVIGEIILVLVVEGVLIVVVVTVTVEHVVKFVGACLARYH